MKARLGSVPLHISFPFVAFTTCLLLMDASGTAAWGLLAAAAHEAGHLLVLFCGQTPPKEIRIQLFDLAIVDGGSSGRSYKQDIALYFAGPAVNLLMAAVFYALYCLWKLPFFPTFASINLLLGLFNLLPVEALDGGQILYALLAPGLGELRAERAVVLLSFFVLLPLAALGFFILLRSQYNYTLLLLSCYLMAALLFKRKNWG